MNKRDKWYVNSVLLILISVFLVGCNGASNGWVRPITVTESDIACMSRHVKEQLVTHNETWEKEQ